MTARWVVLRISYQLSLSAFEGRDSACREAQEVGADLTTRAATHVAAREQENIQPHSLLCLDSFEDITSDPPNAASGDRRSRNTAQRDYQAPSLGSHPVGINCPRTGAYFDSISVGMTFPPLNCVSCHNQSSYR